MSALLPVDVLCVVLAFALALVCARTAARRPSHRYLLLHCGAACLYAMAHIAIDRVDEVGSKLACTRIGYLGAFLLLPVMLNLPAAVLGTAAPHAAAQGLLWGGAFVFAPLAFTDRMFYFDADTGMIGRAGPAFFLTLPFFFLGAVHYVGTLTAAMRDAAPEMRKRLAWLLAGSGAFLIAALPDVLRRVGLVDLFGRPVAAVGVLAFLGCTAYAVLRHRLMDIEIVLSRGLVYGGLVPLLALAYTLTGEVLEQGTQALVHANSLAANLASALVVSVCFDPTRRWLQRVVDGWFVRDREVLERLQKLERAPRMVVADDLDGLLALRSDLDGVIDAVKQRSAAAEEPPVRRANG